MQATPLPFSFDRLEIVRRPFPHMIADECFVPDLFRELRDQFPNVIKLERPKGWGQSLYWGDPEYARHLDDSPAWKKVFDTVHSQDFVDWIVEQFGDLWQSEGCVVDLSKARYVPYCESRENKERFQLDPTGYEPHELWCRLDFYQGFSGYYKPVHLDHQRRLISWLVYFDEQDQVMEGGDLVLHAPGPDLRLLEKLNVYQTPRSFSKLRDRLARTISVKPQGNRTALFMCGRRSWHSVPAMRSARAPRQHIQISISSSIDAWH